MIENKCIKFNIILKAHSSFWETRAWKERGVRVMLRGDTQRSGQQQEVAEDLLLL